MNFIPTSLEDAGLLVSAFMVGVMLVHRYYKRAGGLRYSASGHPRPPATRPPTQIAVRSLDQLVDETNTGALVRSIEHRTRLSAAQFDRDCRPVLESFAEFVQMLPASESHHHAQPGGLWIHVMEVVDAALTFRAGLELPSGASTEDRKRLEHRWTFAVFAGALLHDVGKPVTDLRVTMFADDVRVGRPWAPLAGPMRTQGCHFYTVAFAAPTERDYASHKKLAAMLMHAFVPPRLMRWLAEDGNVLDQLLAYLAGEDDAGTLANIVKKADSDSVRRNLLHGPRTRFSSARARPLIERLMEALRRMLREGGTLPLNRAGAAGWVHEGHVWFVCARLADEVRGYLAQHESAQGVPGKDRNDRLFDTWQEHGAVKPAPDGGAIWRVRIECDGWRSPDVLTVLCFNLDKLYPEPKDYPAAMRGAVVPEAAPAASSAPSAAPAPAASPAPFVHRTAPPAPASASKPTAAPAAATPPTTRSPIAAPATKPPAAPPESSLAAPAAQPSGPVGHKGVESPRPAKPADGPQADPQERAHSPRPNGHAPSAGLPADSEVASPQRDRAVAGDTAHHPSDDVLAATESARLHESLQTTQKLPASATAALTVGAPLRPHDPAAGEAPRPRKGPTPAAEALVAWVAHAIGSGELKYNEDQALVHFVPEGCLLLSPEVFRRFIELNRDAAEGPVFDLIQAHGDRAFARLQNELAKSGWTQRNGDENMHAYAFTKADGTLSRAASFFLLPKPSLFWNPVPQPNERIRRVQPAKKLVAPARSAT